MASVFNSTYFNEGGFHLLRADAGQDHRLKFSPTPNSRYDVAARVWRPDSDETELLVVRAWMQGRCRHLVLDGDNGVLLADGFERREGESWKQVRARLDSVMQII